LILRATEWNSHLDYEKEGVRILNKITHFKTEISKSDRLRDSKKALKELNKLVKKGDVDSFITEFKLLHLNDMPRFEAPINIDPQFDDRDQNSPELWNYLHLSVFNRHLHLVKAIIFDLDLCVQTIIRVTQDGEDTSEMYDCGVMSIAIKNQDLDMIRFFYEELSGLWTD
jgi:hypothetical protein